MTIFGTKFDILRVNIPRRILEKSVINIVTGSLKHIFFVNFYENG